MMQLSANLLHLLSHDTTLNCSLKYFCTYPALHNFFTIFRACDHRQRPSLVRNPRIHTYNHRIKLSSSSPMLVWVSMRAPFWFTEYSCFGENGLSSLRVQICRDEKLKIWVHIRRKLEELNYVPTELNFAEICSILFFFSR